MGNLDACFSIFYTLHVTCTRTSYWKPLMDTENPTVLFKKGNKPMTTNN